jgi:hypothetical protein
MGTFAGPVGLHLFPAGQGERLKAAALDVVGAVRIDLTLTTADGCWLASERRRRRAGRQ